MAVSWNLTKNFAMFEKFLENIFELHSAKKKFSLSLWMHGNLMTIELHDLLVNDSDKRNDNFTLQKNSMGNSST